MATEQRRPYDHKLIDRFREQEMHRVYEACDELAVGGSANIDPALGELLSDLGLVTLLGESQGERAWKITESFRPFFEQLKTTERYRQARR